MPDLARDWEQAKPDLSEDWNNPATEPQSATSKVLSALDEATYGIPKGIAKGLVRSGKDWYEKGAQLAKSGSPGEVYGTSNNVTPTGEMTPEIEIKTLEQYLKRPLSEEEKQNIIAEPGIALMMAQEQDRKRKGYSPPATAFIPRNEGCLQYQYSSRRRGGQRCGGNSGGGVGPPQQP